MTASDRDGLLPIADRRETTRVAWALCRQHRWPLLGAVVSFLLIGACALVPPWMLGAIVDAVDRGDSSITRYAVAIAIAALGGAVLSALSVTFVAHAGEPALAQLREQVLDRALHLDAQRLEAAGSGDLLSRVGDDSRTVAESLDELVPILINSLVLVVFTVFGLLALDWRLALAGLVAAPFYALGLRWYMPRSAPVYREERIAQGERAEALVGGIRGAATLRAFGHEREQLGVIDDRSGRARDLSVKVFRLLTRFFARSNRAEAIGLTAVLGVGFVLVRNDATTIGAVTAAALYFHRLFNPIGALLFVFDQLQSAGASLARLVGVAGLPLPPDGTPGPETPGPLALEGVGHAYREDNLVLEPTLGSARLAGARYDELDPVALRSRVALVSQDFHVFAGTVRDAVSLAAPDADDDAVLAALAMVHARDWVAALPDGLDTVVGDGGRGLTAAQAQQLALARIHLADPWFVVLDEATAEAGSAGARDLERAAAAVTEGRGALVVAHRLTQSEAADRVLVLHDGVVVEQGTHDELVARGGRYAELWAAWSA